MIFCPLSIVAIGCEEVGKVSGVDLGSGGAGFGVFGGWWGLDRFWGSRIDLPPLGGSAMG